MIMVESYRVAQKYRYVNEALYYKYSSLCLDAGKFLAPYQSPTFRAIQVIPPPPEQKTVDKRITLAIFDSGGKAITGEIITPEQVEGTNDASARGKAERS